MKLTIDFETRSRVSLDDCGSYIYSKNPSTEIFCLAIKRNAGKTRLWINPKFKKMIDASELPTISRKKAQKLFSNADIIEAHNSDFEKNIYNNCLIPKYKWKKIKIKWRCSATRAAYFNLPRSLEGAGEVMKLPIQKDKDGRDIMLKMCKPNSKGEWNEKPSYLLKLFKYCIADVESEYTLSKAIPHLPKSEQRIWQVNNKINDRGFCVDVKSARIAIKFVEKYKNNILRRTVKLTNGELYSPLQRDAVLAWLREQGTILPNLQADTVTRALKNKDLPKKSIKLLKLRQDISRSSTAKLNRLIVGADSDKRLRGTLLYHGASTTGRFSGKRFQPHNMRRKKIDKDVVTGIFKLLADKDYEAFKHQYKDVNTTLSKVIRSFIKASPGKELICADYSSIEGRVLAWVAGEKYIIDNYKKGKCAYCFFASQIYSVPYDEILSGYKKGDKEYTEMRFNGKTGELACGYQGSEKAVLNFAPNMPLKQRKYIVKVWRRNRPKTVKLWYKLEECALRAVQYPGHVFKYRSIKFKVQDNTLHCLLPSGRVLFYHQPKLVKVRTPWGDYKTSVSYMSAKRMRKILYGGLWSENIVQAIARDILALALVRVEKANYPIIFHVHDEIICEMIKGLGSVAELCKLLIKSPGKWAKNLPLAADGFKAIRYGKG